MQYSVDGVLNSQPSVADILLFAKAHKCWVILSNCENGTDCG